MEQDNKKRRTGQNIAFYTALAVCLTAVGVGTWQLLRPETGKSASAVSSAVALPGTAGESDGGAFEMPDATLDVSESVPTAGLASEGMESGDGGGADGSAETVSGAASIPADSRSSVKDGSAASDTKSATDSKSDTKPADSKSDTKSSAKPTDSKAADSKSNAKSDSKSSGKASDAKSGTSGKADKLSGEVVRPVEGSIVTGYSMDKLLYNETMRDWRTHDGIDIAADPGTAVVAARAGTVESVTADPIMGTTVTVRHEEKWESVYASLADMAEVEAGDDVSAGQVVGFVGETAASEAALGPHLHFSVLNDGVPVDPETFLA